MKNLIHILIVAGAALLVFFMTREWYRPDTPTEAVGSAVLLERVKPVLKLVTVEGEFNELYTYRNAEATFEWLKQFTPFQKRAILRVKARASVGYDLEGMELHLDEESHTVTLLHMDEPQLLSLEHDVDYYDLEAGAFNAFTAADHTRIQREARSLIRSKVESSGLFTEAEAQRNDMLRFLKAVIENAGWEFRDEVSPVDGRSRLKG